MVMDTLEDDFALIQRNDAKLGGISGMRTSWVRDIFWGVENQLMAGLGLWELRGGNACASRVVWGLAERRHQC